MTPKEIAGLTRSAGWAASHAPYWLHEEARQEAWIGIMKAADRWDPSRGCSLRTYCQYRALGRVLDYLRREDLLPRGVRAGRRRPHTTLPPVSVILTPIEFVAESQLSIPAVQLATAQASQVRGWISELPVRERFLIRAWLLGATSSELATRMNVTQGRISQLKTQAVNRLRERAQPPVTQ